MKAITDRSVLNFVEKSPWGRHLSVVELSKVLASVRGLVAEKGEHIVRAGTEAQCWVGLIDGFAVQSMKSADGQVTFLSGGGEGSWFGEGTLLKGDVWRYDAIALRRTKVALIPIETFRWLRSGNLAFNHFLQDLMNERLRNFITMAFSDRTGTVEERVAESILRLFDPRVFDRPSPFLRLSQTELGMLAGVSRQRANKALTRLQERGLIRRERNGIEILDMEGLRGGA